MMNNDLSRVIDKSKIVNQCSVFDIEKLKIECRISINE